ncbi:DUF2953 domain-containing protein [Neobacillus fumarioli]|uniref:DUF2953 domain-containing protein n=1 Tax=Neobacillus fumarioli TaxID=105229 RepID=UPI000A6BB595|nr:DUF2953 domain-containing protein [Neobacillus fumarioli]
MNKLVWVPVSLFVLLLLIILVLFSKLTILINYQHYNDNDDLKVELRILKIITYKFHAPLIKIDENSPTVVVKSQTNYGNQGNEQSDKNVHQISKHDVRNRIRNIRTLLEKVVNLHVIVKGFLRKVSIEKLEWETLIGLGDAAHTAIATGTLWSMKGSLIALLSHYLKLKDMPKLLITPHFQAAVIQTRFTCMIQFRIGYAILAGLKLMKFWKGGKPHFNSDYSTEKTKTV